MIHTERQLSRELTQSRDFLTAVVASIPAGIIAFDFDGIVSVINDQALALLAQVGVTANQAVDTSILVLVKDLPDLADKVRQQIVEERKVFEFPFLSLESNGVKTLLSVKAQPFANGTLMLLWENIAHIKEIDKAKTEFVSLASHQLRSPLTVISSFSQLLLDGVDGPLNSEQQKSITEIKGVARRMIDLVSGFLNVSRMELGTIAIDPKPDDIIKIAETSVNDLQTKIAEKSLHFETQYDRQLGLLNIDANLMGIIFQNLLTNAIKYTPNGGQIHFSITSQAPNLLIKVQDNGYGIPKEQQSKMFTKLFRADNVQVKHLEGTGLGMYLVKTILEASGGSIRFESEENRGTTFFITIPLSGQKRIEGTKVLK